MQGTSLSPQDMISPVRTLRCLGCNHDGRVLTPELFLRELQYSPFQLGVVIIPPFTCAMQKENKRILGSRFHFSRVHHPVEEGIPIGGQDRKSTRLNSSHVAISYAAFCMKKKNKHMSPFNYI